MSSSSLYACATDPVMNERTTALAVQVAYNDPPATGLDFAEMVKGDPFGVTVRTFQWPVALNCEADYESGMVGGDGAANVQDGQILAAVAANWPQDPAPEEVDE